MTSRSKTLVKLKDEFKDKYPEWASKTLELVGSKEDGRHLIVIDQNYDQFTVAASSFELVKEGGNNVSRSNVVNAKEVGSSPPKSPWFNGKYQVNPETSKLLQEAVFKDGGCWSLLGSNVSFLAEEYLYVDEYGNITWGEDCKLFHDHDLPEKQPPKAKVLETKKELPTHKHTSDHLLDALNTCVGIVRQTNDLTKQTEEKQTMSNKTNRRVLNIQLLDNDAGLPVEHALVAEFNGVVTEDNDQTTLQEIISTGEVAERIKVHNEVRSKQLDLAILKSTGQKVNLLPIKLKDLTWNIK